MDLGAFLDWAWRLARALADRHGQQGVHGRLQPDCVIVAGSGEVRLTAPRWAVRELAYLAPEQTGRLARGIDERSDLYSLGVLYYEALAGRLPFDAVDALEWVHCHLARQPRPLTEAAPCVPPVVADIVGRLLAKQPEERYQTAHGLAADLERCLVDLRTSHGIRGFRLGRHDISPRLVVSTRLYGRDRDVQRLRAAFDRVRSTGRAEIVCVTGGPGVGKSALIRALAPSIAARGGRVLAGKYDRYRRAPHATVAELLGELGSQLLAESPQRLARWRRRLHDALGSSADLLVELAPVLADVLGEYPSTVDSAPVDASTRMRRAMHGALTAIATADHPLVVVLDDLQWAGRTSLDLLSFLLTQSETAHVLVVGAYRPGEVDGAHPLTATLAALTAQGRASEVALAPLGHAALCRLLADTLHHTGSTVAELARVVAEKTGANPLFLGEFLHKLHERGTLRFDPRKPEWSWNLDEIRQAPVTDNVVTLVASRVGLLSIEERQLLKAAALLGDRFDEAILSLATGQPPSTVAATLRRAVADYLILPVDDGLRRAAAAADRRPSGDPDQRCGGTAAGRVFRWAHDRIRQGVLSRIPVGDVPRRRLAIGRALIAALTDAEREERIFEIAEHFDAAVDLIETQAERIQVVELNLVAADKARRTGGPEAAWRHATQGLDLLPLDAWQGWYRLAFRLHITAALAANLVGERQEVQRLLGAAAERARDDLDLLEVVRLRTMFLLDTGDLSEVIGSARQGLALLGLDPRAGLPGPRTAMARIEERLSGLRVEEITEATPMSDARAVLASEFIADLLPSLHTERDLLPVLVAHGIELALEHGPTGASAPIFAYHCATLASQSDVDRAAWSARVAARLTEVFPTARSMPKVSGLGLQLPAWYELRDDLLTLLSRSYVLATEQGDVAFAAYIGLHVAAFRFVLGRPLDGIAEDIAGVWRLLDQCRVATASVITRAADETVAALRGEPGAAAPRPTRTETALASQCAQGTHGYVSAVYLCMPLSAAYLLGQYERTLRLAETILAIPGLEGTIWAAERRFYQSLAITACYEDARPDQRRAWAATLEELGAVLDGCAARGPAAFSPKALLVSAERARLAGDVARATGRYDQAMGAAREFGSGQIEAMAAELAARYAAARGTPADAADYLDRAVACYRRWGANAKVDALTREHAALA